MGVLGRSNWFPHGHGHEGGGGFQQLTEVFTFYVNMLDIMKDLSRFPRNNLDKFFGSLGISLVK